MLICTKVSSMEIESERNNGRDEDYGRMERLIWGDNFEKAFSGIIGSVLLNG